MKKFAILLINSIAFATVSALAGTDDLVASFPLDPSGNIIKETVANRTFDMNRAQKTYTVEGARGRCVHFDGYSNFVKNAKINVAALSNQDITVSIWLAPQIWPHMNQEVNREDWSVVCGNADDNARSGFGFYLSNLGHYTFECWTPDGKVKATSQTRTLACYEWNHLVAVVHGSSESRADRKVSLYNNGELIASAFTSTTLNAGQETFYIGKGAEDVKADVCYMNSFCGLIDDIQIYNGVHEELVSDNTPEHSVNMRFGEDRYDGNILRPRYHGAPDSGWTNETHGLVFWNDRWHLFYQKNPSLAGINRQVWGHMSSENLAQWREERIAIAPGEWYDQKGCWSGCVFQNDAFNGGKPTIAYTGVDYARAMISMAAPLDDDLDKWSKMSGNPAINGVPSGMGGDFRDCYFFENGSEKYMIVGCTKDGVGCATLHKYNNGAWAYVGIFFQGSSASTCGNMWEMPNVTPMGNGKWLFTVTPLGTGKGVKCIYWIGTIGNDGKFTPQQTAPQDFEMSGTSKDGYGLLSPSIYQKDGKTIALGIVPDKVGLDFQYRNGWAHNYCLPRELSLSADGQSIVQKPYEGLSAIRVTENAFEATDLSTTSQTLGDVKGRQVELLAEFTVTSDNVTGQTGFRVLKNGSNYASVYFSSNTVTVDLKNLARTGNDGGIFDGVYTGALSTRVRPGETFKLHVFLDGSILDVFCNDTYAFSVRLFPTDNNAVEVEAFSTVTTTFKTLKAWNLDASQGVSDDIDGIFVETKPSATRFDNRIYDLQGRQLSKPVAKGIYVVNGKKYINK